MCADSLSVTSSFQPVRPVRRRAQSAKDMILHPEKLLQGGMSPSFTVYPTSILTDVPSLVRSLESRVTKLEAQLLALQTGPQNVPFSMASKISQATLSIGQPSSTSYLHSKVSSALVFRPSCPPLAVVRARDGNGNGMTGGSPLSAVDSTPRTPPPTGNLIDIKSIPDVSIWRMIRNYTEIHLPQYPCIQESMLEDIARRARMNDGLGMGVADTSEPGLGHFEYFVLYITLAISANTLTWKAEDQARAASESFFYSALTHLQLLGDHSEISSLQISLLLAHYAHMCPERVDNWTCISDAVRIMLNLALYKMPPDSLDAHQRHLRSTLFWVTYGMERSLCTNLRLPLSFPEEVITAKVSLHSSFSLLYIFSFPVFDTSVIVSSTCPLMEGTTPSSPAKICKESHP